MKRFLNTPIGKISFTKEEDKLYDDLSDEELINLHKKEISSTKFVNPHTYQELVNRGLR